MLRCPLCFSEVEVERVLVEIEGGVKRTTIVGRCKECKTRVEVVKRMELPSAEHFQRVGWAQ